MGVAVTYREHAAAVIRRILAFGHNDTDQAIRDIARQWANCFSESFIENLTDGIAKGLLSRMRTPYDSDEALIESLSSLLVGKSPGRWDDSTIAVFDRELHNVVRRIEDAALSREQDFPNYGVAARGARGSRPWPDD